MVNRLHAALQFVSLAVLGVASMANAANESCTTVSLATIPTVIELYTSEGCN